MKNILKKIVVLNLKSLSSIYLKINKIEVVAITGSAGKTTTKVGIGQLVPSDKIYVPEESYNTEISIPLTIFKEKIPSRTGSIGSWLKILYKVTLKIFKKAPYKRIALEMGADKPGDIDYLVSYIKPSIAVVTTVLIAHTEKFKNIEAVQEEKAKILQTLSEENYAVLNYDDQRVRAMAKKTKAKIFWIGNDKKCDLYWDGIKLGENGISLNLHYEGKKYFANLRIFAPQLIPSLISAFAVGVLLGENVPDLITRLNNFLPQAGRMRILKGYNGSTIIDDSYNANPESTVAALDVLSKMSGRRIAMLGGMNELGDLEEEEHRKMIDKILKSTDMIILIGDKAKMYYFSQLEKKAKYLKAFKTATEAGDFIKPEIMAGDYILVKGSQNGIFAEEAVKKIMEEPEKATTELVRQSEFWMREKEKTLINRE